MEMRRKDPTSSKKSVCRLPIWEPKTEKLPLNEATNTAECYWNTHGVLCQYLTGRHTNMLLVLKKKTKKLKH
jgi:hypothetical protein